MAPTTNDSSQDSANTTQDHLAMARALADIGERSQKLMADFMEKQGEKNGGSPDLDPLNIGSAFMEMTAKMMADPSKFMDAQVSLWQDQMKLWQNTAERMMGQEVSPVVQPDADDRRFKDEAWEENQVFDFIKQSYLLSARWMQNTVSEVEGLDEKTSKKVAFYTKQFADAMAPTNFVMSNPAVLRETMETKGENLVRGLENLLADLEAGEGQLKIKMTDPDAFELGKNIAVTPGAVVYRNDLMELIQFNPTTEKVYKRPLLIIPPWINKYYILDLREKNSFIRWAVSEGFTVFCISWVNPNAELADKSFEDYMIEGPLAALDAMKEATGEEEANVIGYCLGGTLLSALLAVMAEKGDQRIKSATFFTTLTDFSEPGDLGVFIDDAQLEGLEAKMNERGYLDGSEMATTFNMLRANDLIWSFVINNYMMGKDPFPFDLLYWNSDSTRMPAAMHSYYLRKMYQENLLCEPGGLTLMDEAVDLTKIKTPTFMISAREDHIAPWEATYALTQKLSGPVKFVLAASGHIAGVVNPPAAGKYCHWTNDRKPKSAEKWLEGAEEQAGSWWPAWSQWAGRKSGAKVDAREPGQGGLKAIEAAPGSYVRVKATD